MHRITASIAAAGVLAAGLTLAPATTDTADAASRCWHPIGQTRSRATLGRQYGKYQLVIQQCGRRALYRAVAYPSSKDITTALYVSCSSRYSGLLGDTVPASTTGRGTRYLALKPYMIKRGCLVTAKGTKPVRWLNLATGGFFVRIPQARFDLGQLR